MQHYGQVDWRVISHSVHSRFIMFGLARRLDGFLEARIMPHYQECGQPVIQLERTSKTKTVGSDVGRWRSIYKLDLSTHN